MSKKEPLKNIAYDKLKSMILNNEFAPNTYLDEKSLCELLSISRTPIREAINKLEYEDLVQTIPQKGIFVTDFSIQSVYELFQARKEIEPLILKMSAPNLDIDRLISFREASLNLVDVKDIEGLHKIDYEFHDYINSNCSNKYLYKVVSYMTDHFQRVRTQPFFNEERALNGANEHIVIIDTIIQGKYDDLQSLMYEHISSTEKYYYKYVLRSE